MSLPNMTGSQGATWAGRPPHGHPAQPSQPPAQDENGLQTRHMGLKVQYTFEKDQQNCLAKWPHALQIQTIPLDERNAIGLIDLRTCLQAIAQCSPEIINQHDKDYAVYALDYAEEDTPLVGQGMLSWGLEQPGPSTEQKSVTGRVVKNMLAALRGGPPETLEVKLKLNGVPRMQRPQTSHNSGGYGSNAPTPTATDSNSEWKSFVQSNPNLGGSAYAPSMPSPGFPPLRYASPIQQVPSPAPDARMDLYAPQPLQPAPKHNAPTPPTTYTSLVPSLSGGYFPPVPSSQGPGPDDMPTFTQVRLVEPEKPLPPRKPKAASSKKGSSKTASSKTTKKRKGTGNPPGRPRKRARADAGDTSAIEDVTDADDGPGIKKIAKTNNATEDATDADEAPADGPKRKRAKTTKADWPSKAPLNSAPGSLRVAASTSGSLRTMRPTASGDSGVGASHLQEIPRAPTPVPGQPPNSRRKSVGPAQIRRPSMADFNGPSRLMMSDAGIPGPSAQDALSPTDSVAQSPYTAYTPEDSQADIGSSPPVPRSAHSVRSSPPLSSPVLPMMMPMLQADSGFMSGGLDEMMSECDLPLPRQPLSSTLSSNFPLPKLSGKKNTAKPRKATKTTKAAPPPLSRAQTARPASRDTPHLSQNPFARPSSQGSMAPTSYFPHVPLEPMESVPSPNLPPPPPAPKTMVIQHEVPGDPQLLPKQTIYTRPGSARAVARSAPATGTNGDARQLRRSNTEPYLDRQETPDRLIGPPPMVQSTIEMNATETETRRTDMPASGFPSSVLQMPAMESGGQQQTEHIEHMETKLDLQEPEAKAAPQEPEIPTHTAQVLDTQLPEASLSDAQLPNTELSEVEPELQEQTNQDTSTTEAVDHAMVDAPNSPIVEQQTSTIVAPVSAAPEGMDDTDSLLRLLSAPLEDVQDIEPELPSMTITDEQRPRDITSSASSEAIDPDSKPSAPASDMVVSNPSQLAAAASAEASNLITKNMSRKKSIKEKLEKAVEAGKMPTFCSNCGSISTPTWRKVWTQDCDGSPDTTSFSDEPGRIMATIVLEQDEKGKTTKYRTMKKILGPAEDKADWAEEILCNPCGLWLSKYRVHRPDSKWETDFTPKTRVKGGSGKPAKPRSRKRKGQSKAAPHPTSEAYFTTDPIGPDEQGPSPATDGEEVILLRAPTSEPPSRERGVRTHTAELGQSFDTSDCRESSHSRDSGKIQGPATVEEDGMGQTRRLLFPSPKKDGQLKVLGDVAVNIVRTSASIERSKAAIVEKENLMADVDEGVEMSLLSTPKVSRGDNDNMVGLFGTPARPSTPSPRERPTGPFKTPTRPMPSHRPITRSVSKSIKRSTGKSPGHILSHIHQTPTKTPRSSARLANYGQASARIALQHSHAHFAIDESFLGGMSVDFDTPFSSTLNQLLSEANDFTAGSDAHGLADFELPVIDSDTGLSSHLECLDFGHFLTTDAVMPSSPLVMGRSGAHVPFDASEVDFSDWGTFGDLGDVQLNDGGAEDVKG